MQGRFERAVDLWSKVARAHPSVLIEILHAALKAGRLDFIEEHQVELSAVPPTYVVRHAIIARTAILKRRWHIAGLSFFPAMRWTAMVQQAGLRLGRDLEKSVNLLISEGVLRTRSG
jgi:hypothetical protein